MRRVQLRPKLMRVNLLRSATNRSAPSRWNLARCAGLGRRAMLLLSLVFLVGIVPAGVRGADDGYFSISTSKTFLPGEQIGIRLYASGVDALEFRVYKIKDPVAFFERLDDPHQFGHVSEQEQIEEPSWLERFYDWKQDLWGEIRDFFRMQFSWRSRATIRAGELRASGTKIGSAAVFAQAPVLNSSQLVARWRQALPPRFISETQNVPVSSLPKGVYLVEATDGTLRAYTIVIVSDLGVITKAAPGQVLAFAADRQSGAPVAGTDVRLWTDKKEDAHVQTDANGLAQTTLPEGQYNDVRVVAVHGDDTAVVMPYSYNLSSDPTQDWTGYVYTDRPVYRPGDITHFKTILRLRSGEQYKVPAGESVQVQIEDPSSKVVLQTNYAVSSFGTLHGDLTLPVTAALGYYSIAISSASGAQYPISGGFYVEDYKKPEYSVKVTPSAPRVLQGGSIEATIEADYYYGEPVAGAAVTYVVHTSTYYSPFMDRDDDDSDADASQADSADDSADSDDEDYGGDEISEQKGQLDATGKLQIKIPTGVEKSHSDVVYRVEARVTDAANREIDGHNSIIATYGSFQVGISPASYVYKVGDNINATAVAKDYDGQPIQTAIHVELVKQDYTMTPPQRSVIVAAQDVQTGVDGTAPVSFTAKNPGDFILHVTARTPENRTVAGDSWLWVTSDAENWWGGNGQSFQIIPDKKSYVVGDTAHLLVLTGQPESYMLVTTEARTIQSQKIVHATSSSVTVDVPITSDQQPNVYVAIAFFRNNVLFQTTKNVKVPAIQQKLQITIQPSATQFEPGQKATYTIEARDANGKPVSGEFSLGIVDEAIYAIHPDASGDISNAFFGPVYDNVSTDSSLNFYFSGEAGAKEMFLAYSNANKSRPLAQLKPTQTLVQPKVRKVFPDTALWTANLDTDSAGKAIAQLAFPDSLTSWRATVRGVTVDTKVGSAIDNVIVRKNLIVRLAAPRFFRQGDEVVVSAIVDNYLPTAKMAQVSLDVKGLDVLSGATAQVQVASNGEAKIDWRVRAQSVPSADIVAKALTDQESDAMELTLPILPVGVKQTDAKSGSLAAADQDETTTVTLPGDPARAAPALDITLSPSIAGSIFSALDYLTSYPYGCTEQTMSSFLPNIVVARAMKDLQLKTSVDTPALEQKIQAGMARLKDFQHDDGGWGWWKDDDSLVFMTAYVVSGYGQSHAAGYDVDSDSLQGAENFLHLALENNPDMRADLRAYVVYALELNGAAATDEMAAAWSARSSMTTQGLSMLGLAFLGAGDTAKAQEMATKVESLATVNTQEAYWNSDYDSFMEFEIPDSAETTAYAVRLLSDAKPTSALLPKAAFWLVNNRDGGYFWGSTKQTAMVIFGLTEYMKASHELGANFRADVYVNGKQVTSKNFTAADAFNPVQMVIHLDSSQLQSGANQIRIHKTGAGRLYWSASGSYYSSDKHLVQSNKLSLNITRDYFKMTPEQTGGKIVYDLNPLAGDLEVGDIVAVRITLSGSEWRYLLMEDPIPAGAEFITNDNLYELKQPPAWWEGSYTSREFHDDRAAIFQDDFSGQREYMYLLKIVNPGKFQVSPAEVQPMYQPSMFATSDAITVEVK
ncbi:MAG: MG2 domain-containing protein [Candidatus Acidiferrales bacterium]